MDLIVFFLSVQAYIDFEIEQEEHEKARCLYERLLERTQHIKVWMSFAQFELTLATTNRDDPLMAIAAARSVYQRANRCLRSLKLSEDTTTNKEERVMLLEAWRDFENDHGDHQSLTSVTNLLPKRVKKRRRIQTSDGSDAGWEEYFDYIFPEDEASKPNLKLLAMAKAWKKNKETAVEQQPREESNNQELAGSQEQREEETVQDGSQDRDDSNSSSDSDSSED